MILNDQLNKSNRVSKKDKRRKAILLGKRPALAYFLQNKKEVKRGGSSGLFKTKQNVKKRVLTKQFDRRKVQFGKKKGKLLKKKIELRVQRSLNYDGIKQHIRSIVKLIVSVGAQSKRSIMRREAEKLDLVSDECQQRNFWLKGVQLVVIVKGDFFYAKVGERFIVALVREFRNVNRWLSRRWSKLLLLEEKFPFFFTSKLYEKVF